jgi:hypothetical protein
MNTEDIRKALDAATPGQWANGQTHIQSEESGQWVCQLWYKDEENMDNFKNNAHLIANAPTWIRSLLEELAAKDKVLEWYANEENYFVPADHQLTKVERDNGVNARYILSQFKEAEPPET